MHDTRRTRLVLGVLLVAALALITISYRGGSSLNGLSSVGSTVFGPLEEAAGYLTGSSSDSKVSALQKQNAELRAELSQAQLDKADSAQLKRLLQLAGRGSYRIVAASVIAVGADYGDTVTLDAGSQDGIRTNETVLNGAGLVGKVTSVSTDTSTVELATDGSSTVGARLAGDNDIGAVTGLGKGSSSGLLQLELFETGTRLRAGQQVVTFGSVGGHPFVPGVPIGTVTKVERSANSLTQLALLRPFVAFGSLGVVGVVVQPPRVNPRDSVLPPHPSASPSARSSPSAPASSTPGTAVSAGGG